MPWITEHAPATADVDSCVTCGLCLPVCPTYRLTGDEAASPRGRLMAVTAVEIGIVGVDDRFDEVTSYCLQCRACETACPSMVPYGNIIEGARAEVVAQKPESVPRLRAFAVGRVLRWPSVLRIATVMMALLQRIGVLRRIPVVGRQAAGFRRLPLVPTTIRGSSTGPRDGPEVNLFTGCVADPWFADLHRAAAGVLSAAGHRVTTPAGQSCCGALAAHSGLAGEADAMAAHNAEALGGSAPIVVAVAGCGAHLKGYGRYGHDDIAARAADVTELVAAAIDEGRLPVVPRSGGRVAVMDPCHLEHGQRITEPPRRVIEAAGLEVVDADPGGLCCGAAGIYQLDHPITSATLGARKAEAVRSTGVTTVAAANIGCEMQLRRFLGRGHDIRHPVEIYWDALQESGAV